MRILIIGAGGHGRSIADAALSAGHVVVGFVDLHLPLGRRDVGVSSVEVLLSQAQLLKMLDDGLAAPFDADSVLVGIGANDERLSLVRSLSRWPMTPLMHPRACVSPAAKFGECTVVMGGAVVGPVRQCGAGVIINSGAIVDHDCEIGDGVHIGPGAVLCGGVAVGEAAFVGAGATIVPNVSVGRRAVVGAGAVVIRDVPDNAVVIGNPARMS
jgi:sugar O-acyltransferase (sialic acid O-acetyltransferase NeuD family)